MATSTSSGTVLGSPHSSKEVMKSAAGKAIEKELNAVAKCSSNTLHESNES